MVSLTCCTSADACSSKRRVALCEFVDAGVCSRARRVDLLAQGDQLSASRYRRAPSPAGIASSRFSTSSAAGADARELVEPILECVCSACLVGLVAEVRLEPLVQRSICVANSSCSSTTASAACRAASTCCEIAATCCVQLSLDRGPRWSSPGPRSSRREIPEDARRVVGWRAHRDASSVPVPRIIADVRSVATVQLSGRLAHLLRHCWSDTVA